VSAAFDELERGAEDLADRRRIVPDNRQATASLRPIRRKSADDDVSTRRDGASHARGVRP
ncbi:MAG: hypothetical protein WBD71_05255, partial [Xanthobacteraceae bacterium]